MLRRPSTRDPKVIQEQNISSRNMAIPFRLIALGLLVVALLFTIIAAATTGWVVVEDIVNIGLFKSCTAEGEYCGSTLDSLEGTCKSRDQAAQAFSVLAILLLFPLCIFVFLRRFMSSNPIVAKVPAMVDVVLAFIVVFCLTISWGAVANMYKECFCDDVSAHLADTSCGLHYSFALAIIAWLATATAAVLLLLGRAEDSGYSNVSA